MGKDPHAWAVRCGNSGVATLLAEHRQKLDAAAAAEGITIVAHPVSTGRDLDELMRAHEAANDGMHDKDKALCMAMGALEYKQGPLKKKERVAEKTATDYGGDFRQVIGKLS